MGSDRYRRAGRSLNDPPTCSSDYGPVRNPRDFDPPDEKADRKDRRAPIQPNNRDIRKMSAGPQSPPTSNIFAPLSSTEILDGGHKIIDASAGTGKTFTIERIVVELLLTGAANIDQILVVTFTEKATAELRARIRTTIEDVMSGRGVENAHPSDRRRSWRRPARATEVRAVLISSRADPHDSQLLPSDAHRARFRQRRPFRT